MLRTQLSVGKGNPFPGIGRVDDWVYPAPSDHSNGEAGGGLRSRAGTTAAIGTVGYGGGLAPSAATYKGIDCIMMQSNVAGAGRGIDCSGAFQLKQRTTMPVGIAPSADDRAVARFVLVAAKNTDGVQPLADSGFQFVTGGSAANSIIANGQVGFGIQFTSDTQVSFIVKGPNGAFTHNITPAGFDLREWHSYELRVFKATSRRGAFLKILIDGKDVSAVVPAASLAWGAGSNLPTTPVIANVTGLTPVVLNRAGNASNWFLYEFRMIQAPTEAATL